MTVVTQENKAEATLQQEKVIAQPEAQQNPKKEEVKQQETKQENGAEEDPNWKAFREARKKDRLEREAAERRAAEKEAEATALKAAMEAAFSKGGNLGHSQSNQQNEYGQEESEDERINKKVEAAIAQREAAAERARQEREHQEYPQRLMKNLPDFQQTISQENLDYLDYHFPEVSRPLQRLPDGYDRWADIYAAVKKFVPNSKTVKKEAEKAAHNMNKPKSISSPSITQPGEAKQGVNMRDVEARRAERYAEMKRIINGVG